MYACVRVININQSRDPPAVANGARQMYGKSTGIKYRFAFSGSCPARMIMCSLISRSDIHQRTTCDIQAKRTRVRPQTVCVRVYESRDRFATLIKILTRLRLIFRACVFARAASARGSPRSSILCPLQASQLGFGILCLDM